MEKKKYIKPLMKVHEIRGRNRLLTGSEEPTKADRFTYIPNVSQFNT